MSTYAFRANEQSGTPQHTPQHRVSNFLTQQGGTKPSNDSPRGMMKQSYSPPSLSPGGAIWTSSPPYISPIVSPTTSFPSYMTPSHSMMKNFAAPQTSPTSSFPSYMTSSHSIMKNLAAPQTSPTSSFRSFMTVSPSSMMNLAAPHSTSPMSSFPSSFMSLSASSLMDLAAPQTSPTSFDSSKERFSGVTSSMHSHHSPSSSTRQDSRYPHPASSDSSSFRASSKSTLSLILSSTPSLESSQEMTSPGLSSSRDSGFSSPSPTENGSEVVPQDNIKARKGQKTKSSTRTNFTTDQTRALQKMFEETPYPDSDAMETVAMELRMSEKQVKIWFQNRRARHRRRKAGSTLADQHAMRPIPHRIYAPMTPVAYAYPAPATMPMATPVTMPMAASVSMPMATQHPLQAAIPMYMPTSQGHSPTEMSSRPELLRNRPVASCPQSWNSHGQTPAVYRNVQAVNGQFPHHGSWSGLYPC